MSSSKSSQSSAQNYTDNRAVLGEDALYANNGASISNYVLDGGAINAALSFAKGVSDRASDSSGRVVDSALTFGSDALGMVDGLTRDTSAKAFNFGSDALALGDGAMSRMGQTLGQAFNFGSDALATNESALQFAGGALGRVLDTTADTQQLVADAYNDAKGRGAMTDKMLIGAIVAMAVVAFAAVHKG